MLLVLALALPVGGLLTAFLAGGRYARGVALTTLCANGLVAAGLVAGVWQAGTALTYPVGGWAAPLGIVLRADGLSAVMVAVSAIVLLAAGIFAEFQVAAGKEARQALTFWVLLPGLAVAMNAVFLGNDLFNLYVALELITFAGVPLVCLKGTPNTLQAALRYLIFALLGSALCLLGIALLYGAYGALDLDMLARRARIEPPLCLAVALITVGLAAKTALFPLHLWLPPAHAGAPPAASALLSALVVKGSFIFAVRIWFDLAPELLETAAAQIPGIMGAGAILVGGVMALRQNRLKPLIAYSTVAQIGYLFLIFPLAAGPTALTGGIFQAVSHAFAKAAMFLAAGLMVEMTGSDRLGDLRGVARALPLTVFGLGLAAVSLVGVPPTGGFLTKWLLLSAAFETGRWIWAVVIFVGGLLAGGYMFRAVAPAFRTVENSPRALETDAGRPFRPVRPIRPIHPVHGRKMEISICRCRAREIAVLVLALAALTLGMFPEKPLELLAIGRTHATEARP